MGVFQGVLKNYGAAVVSNLVGIITSFVLPFVFLHRYGTAIYADWIVLSASVSYLSTLNFGIQTYVNQDLAIRYNRGERQGYHVQQSTALRLLLGIVVVVAAACLVVFLIPVERLLRLTISHSTASFALYFIALQVLLGSVVFSYFSGNFMGLGLAHRGANWANAQRLSNTLVLCALGWMRVPLSVLAGGQLAVYVLFILIVLIDLKRVGPEIFPTLRYWDRASVPLILKQSSYFGLIAWSTVLSYQLPLILLQRMVGPGAVVVFSLMRQIFGFGRQVLNGMTQAMGPEITRVYGTGDWPALVRLYNYSERFIFGMISVVNLGLFYGSPILLVLWQRSRAPGLFQLWPYLLISAINIVLSVKEHKYQFQVATNTQVELSRVMFFGYVALGVISLATIHTWGLAGFLWTWLGIEIFQTAFIIGLNMKLFAEAERLTLGYILRLTGLATAGLVAGFFLLRHTVRLNLAHQVGGDIALLLVVAVAAYFLFQLRSIWSEMKTRIQSRLQRA